MNLRTIMSFSLEDDADGIANQLRSAICFAVKQQFHVVVECEARFDGAYDIVVHCNSGECLLLRKSLPPFLQNVLLHMARTLGWNYELHTAYPKRAVHISILGRVSALLREIRSDFRQGTKVSFRAINQTEEYAIWVGGPFRNNGYYDRSICYGLIIGSRNVGGRCFARVFVKGEGERVFLVDDPAWIDRMRAKYAVIYMERFRGGKFSWRLRESIDIDCSLDSSWLVPEKDTLRKAPPPKRLSTQNKKVQIDFWPRE